MLTAADDPNVADWISAVGQALGALFTAVAVGVALWIAHRDARQRLKDDHQKTREALAKAKAQARLIRVKELESIPSSQKQATTYSVLIRNASDRPIIKAKLQAVLQQGDAALVHTGRALDVLDPSRDEHYLKLELDAPLDGQLLYWRVSWLDPDGIVWQVEDRLERGRAFGPEDDEPYNSAYLALK